MQCIYSTGKEKNIFLASAKKGKWQIFYLAEKQRKKDRTASNFVAFHGEISVFLSKNDHRSLKMNR